MICTFGDISASGSHYTITCPMDGQFLICTSLGLILVNIAMCGQLCNLILVHENMPLGAFGCWWHAADQRDIYHQKYIK